jgi:transcriptional regulator with XRE-family HTH domain
MRKEKSLRQVAKELGVSASYLSQIRHGKRPASEKMLNTLLFKDVQSVKQDVKHDKGTKECYNSINTIVSHDESLGHRLAVGQRTLDPLAEVRILVPQLFNLRNGAFV